jgi:hypothetical protein
VIPKREEDGKSHIRIHLHAINMKNHNELNGITIQNLKSVSNESPHRNNEIPINPEYLIVHSNHQNRIQILMNLTQGQNRI